MFTLSNLHLGNYEEPVKKYFLDDLMEYIIPGMTLEKTFSIQKNFLDTKDSPWPYAPSQTHEFYQVGSIDDRLRMEKYINILFTDLDSLLASFLVN